MFIELTRPDGRKVWINSDRVLYVEQRSAQPEPCSDVVFDDTETYDPHITVKETADYIAGKANRS